MRKGFCLLCLLAYMFIAHAETWVNIGKGHWLDPVWISSGQPYETDVTIERSSENPYIYRAKIFNGSVSVTINTEVQNKVYISPYTRQITSGKKYTVTQNCGENGMSGSQYGNIFKGKVKIPGNYFIISSNGETPETGNSYRKCEITFPDGFDSPTVSGNGVFMGIIGFNDEISRKSISLLNEDTKKDFTSFVNGLQMGNATLLYYGVEQAINEMKSQFYPDNLSKAILLTFTDGLDQGSLGMKPEHRTSKGYADYLSDLISNTNIQDHPLEAYAIGLMSDDVYDDEMFMYNLNTLASDDDKISPVNNIEEVQQTLTEIFESLNQQTSQRIVTIKVPTMSHGDKYRFTLDNSSSAINSNLWFEGIFNIDRNSLDNVSYHGFTSTSGARLESKKEGVKLIFTLTDCRDLNGNILDVDKNGIDQWMYIPSRDIWNHNIENAKADDIEIEDIKSSVAIMFALDCSTSLGELFPVVQSTANSFIDRLAGGNGNTSIDQVFKETNTNINTLDPIGEFYNLQGIRVSNPTAGIYIYRKGNMTKKLIIK